jgi:hypothetical protein
VFTPRLRVELEAKIPADRGLGCRVAAPRATAEDLRHNDIESRLFTKGHSRGSVNPSGHGADAMARRLLGPPPGRTHSKYITTALC